jgi:hypothetical protein
MDRLKALLGDQPARQRDKSDRGSDSREKERSALNHEDAKYNKQVYENEKRQADLYNQSQMPESSKDVGVSFKIGSFVNKISQLLSFKNDLYTQLQALINLSDRPSPGRLLTDSRLISIATDYFKMTDIIANYNELVNYINLYAPQMKADEDFKSGINTTYLLPLLALFNQTANLYVAGFNEFPNARQGNEIDRNAYARMRQASALSYSTISLMNANLTNAIYQPITRQGVEKYMSDKNVLNGVFGKNPFPVAPIQQDPNLPQPPPGPPGQPIIDPNAPPQPGGAPAQPVNTGQLSQADISQVLRATATLAQQQGRVPYYSEGTRVFDATDLGGRGLRAKGVVAQILGDVREAVNLKRNTKPSQKNDQISAQAYNINAQFFQELATGQPPQALMNLPGFQSRIAQPAPPSPPQQPASPPVSPVIQPGSPQQQPAPAPLNPPSPVIQPQPQQPGGGPAGQVAFSTFRDVPQVVNGSDNVRGIAQVIVDNERRNGAVFDGNDPKDLSKILGVLKQANPQLYDSIRNRGPQDVLDDAEIMSAEIKPVMDAIRMYKMDQVQRGVVGNESDLFGLGRQRKELEDRKYLAERARGDPRVVDMSQGREKREKMMPFINEFSAPAEFLKRRGEVMSGGVVNGVNDNINDLVPYEMYGGNVDYDDAEEMTPFKRRIGMPNPFAYKPKMDTLPIRPVLSSNATDIDESLLPFQQMFSSVRGGFEKEKEKPKDMDENPDPIRITNENYKIFTGKQKAPKYKILS